MRCFIFVALVCIRFDCSCNSVCFYPFSTLVAKEVIFYRRAKEKRKRRYSKIYIILWIYILGVITLIKIFYGLSVTFLGKKQKNAILDISIVFDFLLGVGLTVYLIYLIPDEFNNLQTIVTAIIAAVYGGLLTLVGVAWTIKKGDKDRKEDLERHDREKMEEERKRLVPYIKISIGDNITSFVNAELHKINLNED